MIARKRGNRRIAFAGTARLFASWSEIVCPKEAFKLVQSFAVSLWRFANADAEVAELVSINPVVPQPVTEVAESVRFNPVAPQPVTAVTGERKRPKPKAAAETSTTGAKQGKYDDCYAFIQIDD